MAFVANGELAIVLNYGPKSDWVRNVLAAGSAGIVHRGRRFRLNEPRVVPIGQSTLAGMLAIGHGHGRCALEGTLLPA